MKTIHATYEDGVLRPSEKLELPPGTQVELLLREPQDDPVTVLRTRFPESFGGLSPEVGRELQKLIADEFPVVEPDGLSAVSR